MTDHTAIQWTHQPGTTGETWNPTTGCDRISPGCDNCYALTMAKRLKAMGSAKYQTDGDPRTSGPGFGLVVHGDTLAVPLRWRSPRTVFVNSMSDLFHARVPREFVARVFAVMAATPQHTFQVLTKRPERMARMVASDGFYAEVLNATGRLDPAAVSWSREVAGEVSLPWPLPNCWLGASIESDEHVARADHLRATPAAVRFLSLEPLLGPLPSLDLDGIGWVLVGGESGPGARPCELGWLRELRDQCSSAGVAFFCKQLGAVWAKANCADSHGGDWGRWPSDLRVREWPLVSAGAVAA